MKGDNMTKETARELFCEAVAPVILGNGLLAHILALKLNLKYGLSSVLCGRKKNLLDLISLDCGFFSLSEKDDRLRLEQLSDFSDTWNECILVLIPTTDADRRFIEKNRDALECRYLISENGHIDRLPFEGPERWV